MQRSYIVGSFIGILLTATAAYYLFMSKQPAGRSTPSASVSEGVSEPVNLPLVSVGNDFQLAFPGQKDLVAHRAALKPSMKLEAWDKFAGAWGRLSAKLTLDCALTDVASAISIQPAFVDPMINRELNVVIINNRVPRCYAKSSRLAVFVDDPIGNTTLYRVIGEALVNRVLEFRPAMENPIFKTFLRELGLSFEDATYLMNADEKSFSADGLVPALHISFSPQKPILDPNVVPRFVPGAEVIRPESITRYFQLVKFPQKPVFVDTRMRRGNLVYPGAVLAPFQPSNSMQSRYRLDLPISSLGGAKFDISQIPEDQETPLLIFGHDATDAGPLWMIRNLQLKNYVNLYYVEGGIKALLESRTPITF